MPPLELVEEAKRFPDGWVYEISGSYGPHDAVPPEAIKGAPSVEKPEFKPTLNVEEMRANLREAIERLNEMMRKNGRELNFSMDESIDRVVITVKNSQTGEIVRQIPDAAAMRVAHNLESLKGMLHNASI